MTEKLPLRVVLIPVTPFQQNCSLMWNPDSGIGAVVDPGGDIERIKQAIAANKVRLEKILITHAHLDHAGAAADLAAEFGVPIEGPHREDQFWIDRIEASGQQYGMPWCKAFSPDRWLEDNDAVTVAGETFEVIHCPGHTPGHVVFFHRGLTLAFVGDVLFRGSIGRTDFPRGNHQDLLDAITGKLWPLGDDVTFVPGHGATSTFGQERRSNPFVGDQALAGR
jgi:glyoxylase-like metal-dependent hydrolase (beta-lactamase superfamily II)